MQLSPNFTYEELVFSEVAVRKGIPNVPNPEEANNLMRLANQLLEPARSVLKVPIHVNSGYRSLAVNTAVGGSPISAHMDGCAADIVPIGLELRKAFDVLRTSLQGFDQIIIECNAWIHVSLPRVGASPRLMAMSAWGAPGNWKYVNVA